MSIYEDLAERSENKCEICSAENNLEPYLVPPAKGNNADEHALLCSYCIAQIDNKEEINPNHWRCLNESMWSQVPAVQVLAWRMLNRLKTEGWSQNLLDIMYMEQETKKWAEATGEGLTDEEKVIHKDSNGAILEQGDTVFLIKDLNVKGGGFTAKRGTAVRNISLIHDNAEQIEGKVEGQQIVILTKFVKKQ